jgi:hypothetical protein
LQALEFLHFMLRLCRLSWFATETRQPKMRLRCQRALLLNGKKFGPSFLGGGIVTLKKSCLAQ